MSAFIPGNIVKEFTTKSGKPGVIRYVQWQDVTPMLEFMNMVATEDTFITIANTTLTLTEEANYLGSVCAAIELQNMVKLVAEVDGVFAGICDVSRDLSRRERGKHVGRFGLIVGKDYRGDGVGAVLSQSTIEEAKRHLPGLRMIVLECFAINTTALALYKKLGFEQTGLVPEATFYKDAYTDEVQMALRLV